MKIPADIQLKHINTYKAAHPIDNLVDGTRFRNMAAYGFDTEFLNYAPSAFSSWSMMTRQICCF